MPTSMRLTKGTKVEVFTRKEVVSGSWLPATILSGNGHTYRIQYDDCPPGMQVSHDRVPRKAVRLPPPPPPPIRLNVRVKTHPFLEPTGPPQKKAKEAEQVFHRGPETEDDDAASVGSNSPHRPAGNGERRWSHRDEPKVYRFHLTSLCEVGPTISWEQNMYRNDISDFLGVTRAEHRAALQELRRSRLEPDALSSA